MKTHLFFAGTLGAFLLLGSVSAQTPTAPAAPTIEWRAWDDSVFAEARRDHKFVLLDLQAVWCHWCHVMDDETYSNPEVIRLMRAHFIAVRVDQDSRPDLANRYEDYGWPATVVYNSDGREIVKRSGFLPPAQMTSMLQAIIDDPSPGPSARPDRAVTPHGTSTLSEAERAALIKQMEDGYDGKLGGWGTSQKFLNWDNVEYDLEQAQNGDEKAAAEARQTLDAQLQLIDPVWGGVDQYSAEGDWKHPHFEKVMQMQAENIRIYARAYAQWKNPAYLQAAEKIYGYVRTFLTSPDGVVYTSQDADLVPGQHAADYFALADAARRKLGVPRIDLHIYARENGWFITALASLYAATGDARYRDEAVRAAGWIIQNRSVPDGGFRHGENDGGLLNLGDNLAMARALLQLHAITGDAPWLERARRTGAFIAEHLPYRVGGLATGFATASGGGASGLAAPRPEFDENVALARFANLLFHYTGDARDRRIAEAAMCFVSAPEISQARFSSVGGLLLADGELSTAPLHLTVVGRAGEAATQTLFLTAVEYPRSYKQVERLDPDVASSQHTAISYPVTPQPAAYLCTNNACSSPVFDAPALLKLLERKLGPRAIK